MPRSLIAFTLSILLAVAAAGCGSGSSSSTSTSSTGGSTAASQAATSAPSTQATTEATPQPGAQGGGSGQGGQGSSSPTGGSGSSASGAENSIQTYGSEAASAQKTALAAAAHSFFAAMAARDYAKVCDGLTASNRAQLQLFLKASHKKGGCPTVLKALMPRTAPEARKAAAGKVTSVRVKGSTAFVLFRPKGGPPSYIVMKREGAAWKAISLVPGTPLSPLAGVRK